ncbi:DUF6531 domain-containing protein [Streptomyces sp. NBC_01803]|uniref:DUF6531 domain-containing protein n=1 Tax=Streptomyces sp. NBC_01803 TaxID=2975946 RepID=UPI00308BBE3F|nr:DUF6531 domain-containing protein [Streptomyces sp. NBC_01803]
MCELAEGLQAFADDVGEALGKIRGMASDRAVADWSGLSADAFRSEFDGVPENLAKLQTSYDMAADALAAYWPVLRNAQGMADRALERAVAAQADLSAAQGQLSEAEDWVSRAGDEAERLEREGERDNAPEPPSEDDVRNAVRDRQAADAAAGAARDRVATAESDLSAARQLAEQAREMREEAARQCASGIDEASDAGIQNRKWWQKAFRWVQDNWDTIVDVCKVIVAVLGVVVMIIGGPLAWVVLAAALVVLADTLVKYARGQATLLDVAFAALDCVPGMKGLTTLGGLARGMRSLATTGMRGLAQGARGLGRQIRQRGVQMVRRNACGDPVDMATGELIMPATDLQLPGVLPLILERHHISTYRHGRSFGRSWASTLDQRLDLDEAGVRFYTADGMVLEYPVPSRDADAPVMPVEGPRWGLAWDGEPRSPLTVHQREEGRTLHFAPVAGRRATELPLTAVTDRNGNRIDFLYADDGDLTELVHSGGYRVRTAVHGNRVTSLRLSSDPAERLLIAYGYDDAGNLAEVYNSSGMPLRLEYDEQARLTRWEDRNGTWYRYEYDEAGRCVFSTGTERALEYRYTYDAENHRSIATNSLGHATVYRFNDSFQLLAETDPLGHTTHHAHDRYDRALTVTDPLGRSTRYEHDDHGRVTAVTRPDGRRLRAEYNELGLISEITQADGSVWSYAYDAAGNRTAVLDPAGNRTRYVYDAHGGLGTATDAAGNVTRVRCDAAGLPVAFTNARGETTEYRRDSLGRTVRVIDPLGGVRTAEYTLEGRTRSQTDPLGGTRTWSYDPEGNCLTHTDANGGTTRYEYGPFDLPVSQTGPDGVRYALIRDTELHITQVMHPDGHTWDYTYDAAGRLISETDFDGHTLTYRLDAAGQLIGRTNAVGQTVTYTRDALGLPVRKDADGHLTTLAYDPLGRLLTATGPETELTVRRDATGRLTSETVNGRTTTYGYDVLGRPVSRTTPSGHTSGWSYDEAGRLASLLTADRTLAFDHDAAGRETRRVFSSGFALANDWDAAGRLTSRTLTDTAGRTLQRQDYAYRADHFLTEAGDTRFDLDASGRVLGRTDVPGGWRETYAYDAQGNQISADWTDPTGTTGTTDAAGERAYAGTLLTRAGRVRYEYDRAGRLVLRQKTRLSKKPETWRYEWDAEDRLTALTTPDGTRWRYLYDPFGRRVAKRRLAADGSVAEETTFTWSGTTLVEQSGSGTTLTWDYDGHRPLTQVEQSEVDRRFYAIVTDLVGTPTHLVDEEGATAWESRTTLYGVIAPGSGGGGPTTPLRFPGQYHDPESGLHYNYQRYYDPETARYLTLDPLGLLPAPNARTYVTHPLHDIDPLGLAAHTVVLYHGAQDFRGSVFQLGAPSGVAVRGATPEAGVYLTNDLTRAIQQYAGPGGRVVRVEVPADFADRIRQMGGPPGNRQEEWFVNNADDLAVINDNIVGIRDSMDAFMAWMNR